MNSWHEPCVYSINGIRYGGIGRNNDNNKKNNVRFYLISLKWRSEFVTSGCLVNSKTEKVITKPHKLELFKFIESNLSAPAKH